MFTLLRIILLNIIILNLLSCPYYVRCNELLKITLYVAEQNIRDQRNQHSSSMCSDNEKIHKVIEIKYKPFYTTLILTFSMILCRSETLVHLALVFIICYHVINVMIYYCFQLKLNNDLNKLKSSVLRHVTNKIITTYATYTIELNKIFTKYCLLIIQLIDIK